MPFPLSAGYDDVKTNDHYANGGKIPWEVVNKCLRKPVSTIAGQAASRAAIDTQLDFR